MYPGTLSPKHVAGCLVRDGFHEIGTLEAHKARQSYKLGEFGRGLAAFRADIQAMNTAAEFAGKVPGRATEAGARVEHSGLFVDFG
jgi:hypothetical protein